MASRPIRSTLLLGALVAAQACSSSTTSTTPTSSLSLTLASATAAVIPGGSVDVPGTLTRNNFTGDVEYVLDNAPNGMTVGQVFIPGFTTDPVRFEIRTTADVPLGTYPLAVRAIGGSGFEASARLTLTVAATLPSDVTSLAASPDTLSMSIGGAAVSSAITPTLRAGYTGGLGFSTSGVPAGINPAISITVGGSVETAVLTLTPAAGLVPGTYPIVVSGIGPDQIPASVSLTVIVR